MVILQGKGLEAQCNLTDKIYKTKYGVFQLNGLKPRAFPVLMPNKNPYIPTNFTKYPLEN